MGSSVRNVAVIATLRGDWGFGRNGKADHPYICCDLSLFFNHGCSSVGGALNESRISIT